MAGEFRSCVVLKGAYKQVLLTDEFSRKILAVVTPCGYAIPNRLMFGVKGALTDRQTDRLQDRKTDRQTKWQTERQRDRQTNKDTDSERQTETEREREKE